MEEKDERVVKGEMKIRNGPTYIAPVNTIVHRLQRSAKLGILLPLLGNIPRRHHINIGFERENIRRRGCAVNYISPYFRMSRVCCGRTGGSRRLKILKGGTGFTIWEAHELR